MTPITVYRIRHDSVFDGDVEILVNDSVMSPIPAGHTRTSPHPIPEGHYAVMRGGWQYVEGSAPAAFDIATPTMWTVIRDERNKLLAECDWTQLPDVPVDAAVWATYRQELRDVTTQADPFAIVWPESPSL